MAHFTSYCVFSGGNWPLDHDDGSRFIVDRFNVVVYGGPSVTQPNPRQHTWCRWLVGCNVEHE